ncbi:hypothetical protein ABMA28_003143 [Loxostege sticticalis]|uniref:Uncharacterized protein n=1 Tax=Loxostege sticticalis TaxID=481309 RepID=A0ABD0SXI4_LOXSC
MNEYIAEDSDGLYVAYDSDDYDTPPPRQPHKDSNQPTQKGNGRHGRPGKKGSRPGASTTPSTTEPSSNRTIDEIMKLLAKINDAIKASDNLRRDIKNVVVNSTKQIKDLLLADPESVQLPTQADPVDTANLVRSVVREELAKFKPPTPAPAPTSSFADVQTHLF